MKKTYTLFMAVLVLVSGLALAPVMGMPDAGFRWQHYADVYTPTALSVNHPSGAPGSFFTVFGVNYPPSTMATILVNGVDVGEVETEADGSLEFVIDTTGAALGYYTVVASPVPNVSTRFLLEIDEPEWPQNSTAPVLLLPDDLAQQLIFMPLIGR